MNRYFLFPHVDPLAIHIFHSMSFRLEVFYSTIFLIGCSIALDAQPCSLTGIITLETQSEVDDFQTTYGPCTVIEGTLIINVNNIDNLQGLIEIQTIQGDLFIDGYNEFFLSLQGLNSLETIGGDLSLIELSIENLNALESLTYIEGNLELVNNYSLLDIIGLQSVKSIGGEVILKSNSKITSLKGLSDLKRMNSLHIEGSPLPNLVSLCNLDTIDNILLIRGLDELRTLEGLKSLRYVGDHISVDYNSELISLEGLTTLEYTGGLFVIFNDKLQTVSGFESLSEIGNISIESNFKLREIGPFSNLEIIKNAFNVGGNDELERIFGFNSLSYIRGELFFNTNENLKKIEGFEILKSVNVLWLLELESLTEVNAFSSLESVDFLWVAFNPNLSNCCSFCRTASELNSTSFINISDNNQGCNNINEIQSCEPCVITNDITIVPTLSQWCVVILSLLLLIVGSLKLMQASSATA